MPSRSFHTIALTDDLDQSLTFLTDVMKLAPVRTLDIDGAALARVFEWPPDSPGSRVALVGEPPGMIELVEIPESLRDTVKAGFAMVSVATGDVEGIAERAAAAGAGVSGPHSIDDVDGNPSTMAFLTVGALRFEAVRFGS